MTPDQEYNARMLAEDCIGDFSMSAVDLVQKAMTEIQRAIAQPMEDACASVLAAGVWSHECEIRHHYGDWREVLRVRGVDMFETRAQWPDMQWPAEGNLMCFVTHRWLSWPPPGPRSEP